MKTSFKIIKVDNYAVVLMNNSSRIADVLGDVESLIKKKKYFGSVIFDMLLANGFNNRFFEMPFEEQKFIINKLKKITHPDDKLIFKANKYYLENVDFLNSAVITRLEKNIIKTQLQKSF